MRWNPRALGLEQGRLERRQVTHAGTTENRIAALNAAMEQQRQEHARAM